MTAYPISVKSNIHFKTVVDFMSERGFGHIIITKRNKPTGIFTEREVLKHIITNNANPKTLIKEIGQQPFESIEPSASILEAAKIMISKKSHLLVFAESKKLVGIITASDMLRAFRKTDNNPPITPFIRKKLVTCNSKISIKEAAKKMHDKGVGSLVVSNFTRYGIFTERDILYCLKKRVSLNEEIEDYCPWPLIKSKDSIHAKDAASIMAANNIKRLGILHDKDLTGIVTALDLVKAYQKSSGDISVSCKSLK